jgi:hypothetical protein
MHNFLVDHPEMVREELWSWSFVGEVPTTLFRVEGEMEAYRERIAAVDSAFQELRTIDEKISVAIDDLVPDWLGGGS